jgi:glycosyltransferase involved in cell wall biosynthesis
MSLTSPFFSIVIPTYNRADLIAATLRSVHTQEFIDFEVLIIDDGSKDNTAEVVQSFIADARFQYLPKPNEERGVARNYGLARARGEYVLFLDSDDRLHSNHLSTLLWRRLRHLILSPLSTTLTVMVSTALAT